MGYFVNEYGEVFEADDSRSGDLREQGLTPATPEDIAKHNERVEYGTAGQQSLAAVESAGRAATAIPGLAVGGAQAASDFLGITDDAYDPETSLDPLFTGFGEDEEIRARARVFEEESPVLAGAASVAPDVLAALGTLGAAGVLTAGGRLAATKAGTLGARLASATAAESAITGTSRELSSAYVQDREFSATNAASNVLMDAAFNFGVGGAIAGAGKLLGSGSNVAKTGRNFLAEAVGPSKVRKVPGGSSGAAAAVDFDEIAEVAVDAINRPEYRASVIELADQADGIIQRNAVGAADRLDDMQVASKQAGYEHKVEEFRRFESGWTEEMVSKQTEAIDQGLEEGLELLDKLQGLEASGRGSFGAKAANARDDIREALEGLADARGGSERLIAYDKLKRTLDRTTNNLSTARGAKADPEAQQAWINEIMPVADRYRERLQDHRIWGGDVADLQNNVNAGFHQEIEAGKRINSALYENLDSDFGVIGQTGVNRRAKAEAIEAWMKKDPAHARGFDEDLGNFIEGRERRLQAFADAGINPPPELQVGLDAAREVRKLFNVSRVTSIAKKRAPEVAGKLSKRDKALQAILKAADYAGGTIATGGIPVKIPVSDVLRGAAKRFGQKGLQKADDPFAQLLSESAELWAKDAPRMTPDLDAGWSDMVRELTEAKLNKHPPGPSGAPPRKPPPTPPTRPPDRAPDTATAVAPSRAVEPESPPVAPRKDPRESIRDAAFELGGNKTKQRVTIKALREKTGLPAEELHEQLRQMQRSGDLVLYQDDAWKMKRSRGEYMEAMTVGDSPRHLVYLENAPAEKTAQPAAKVDPPKLDPNKVKQLIAENDSAAESLTASELDALHSYTSRRGDKVGTPEWESALEKVRVENPTKAGALYSGTRIPEEQLQQMLRAGRMEVAKPTSTSYNPGVSEAMAISREERGVPVVFRINSLKDGYALLSRKLGIGGSGMEREIMIRDAQFRVQGATQNPDHLLVDLVDETRGNRSAQAAIRAGLAMSPAVVALGMEGQAQASELQITAAEIDPSRRAVVEALNEIAADGEATVATVASALVTGDFDGELPELQDVDIEKWRDALSEDPAAFVDRVGGGWGDLPNVEPEVFSAIMQKMAGVRAYLAQNLPQRPGQSIANPEGFPVRKELQDAFAARVVGATRPKDAMMLAAAGIASPFTLEALQANWGGLWTRLQIATVAEYQEAMVEGTDIPEYVPQMLDRDLGLGSVLGVMHSPELSAFLAQNQEPEQPVPTQTDFPGGTRLSDGLTPDALEALRRDDK